MKTKCNNKVVITISISQALKLREIFGGLKSIEGSFFSLISAIKKIQEGKESQLTNEELQVLDDAANYPFNFSDNFKEFFDNYELIHSLVAYSTDD